MVQCHFLEESGRHCEGGAGEAYGREHRETEAVHTPESSLI